MASGERFKYLRGNGEALPPETPNEKLLRILAAQHPAQEASPQSGFTPLDIMKQIHGDNQTPPQS